MLCKWYRGERDGWSVRQEENGLQKQSCLLVDFVKGSGVVETAIPDFVDDSGSVGLVFAAGPVGD